MRLAMTIITVAVMATLVSALFKSAFGRELRSLIKFQISLMIGVSSYFGFCLNRPHQDFLLDFFLNGFLCFVGVFLLSAGASALNNIQDRHRDKNMVRTRHRPLASGRLTVALALGVAIVCLVVGSVVLYLLGRDFLVPTVGLASVFLYNFVYTTLKSKSLWGIVAGAICGALPVVIGWMASSTNSYLVGGVTLHNLMQSDSFLPMMTIFTLVFLWQLPHFWLLMLHYQKDYEPNLRMLQLFGKNQVERITLIWSLGFGLFQLFLPLFDIVSISTMKIILVINVLVVLAMLLKETFSRQKNYLSLFITLNCSMCLVMGLVIIEKTIFFGSRWTGY